MNNTIVKAALPGEGKTRWLMDQIYEANEQGFTCFICMSGDKFNKFREKYLITYHRVCPLSILTSERELDNSCAVFIDDFLNELDQMSYNVWEEIMKSECTLFITIEGTTSVSTSTGCSTCTDYEQLKIVPELEVVYHE